MSEVIDYIEDEAEDEALDVDVEGENEVPAHLDIEIKKANLRFSKIRKLVLKKIAADINYRMAKTKFSAQPADIEKALDDAGLWGGSPFDLQGKVADKIFGILDGSNYKGKFSASLTVATDGGTKISITKGDDSILKKLQSAFGPKMSRVLKRKKILPAEEMTLGWLENVGY